MQNTIRLLLKQIMEDKAKRRKMRSVLCAMSILVALGVVWQLKITGITMTGEALCGYLEHQHSQECEEKKLTCAQEEGESHTHTDDCYTLEQVCGYETEHVHTVLCYSDVNADLENSSVWEATLPGLSGKIAEDLVRVAQSQVGYTESIQNYKVADDGVTKMGYTRYGEWYGNPYGNWNAMFVSFCLHYAQHPAYETLKNSGVESMRLAAETGGLYQAAAGTVPYVGDLAFLDKDSNGSCDTVAIVTDREGGAMTLVEGDCGGIVAENTYSLGNGTVLGYALLTPQAATADEPIDEDGTYNLTKRNEEAAQADGNITITFVINNPDYTHDPGSGYTHLTVSLAGKNNPASDGYSTDGGLSYEYWTTDGRLYKHKVTDTGTLMTRSIPAGTTLAASGFALPNVSTTNIADGNTYSYVSPYSWVTNGGMICNANTVFAEDTTLYLSLYPSGQSYNLNWVCNCENGGSHSVYYNLTSRYPSPTFALGQSLSANYILSAEDVNRTYAGTPSCNVGSSHNKVFTGWYLKNETTGEEVEFGVGVPFQAEYVDPNSGGNTIKVYARWQAADVETVTATFMNGETVFATQEVEKGSVLGTLPKAPAAETGKYFIGWQVKGSTDNATAETVISEDTTFYAVYGEDQSFAIYFHDIAPDGTDREKNGQDVEISQMVVPQGSSIAKELLGESLIYDETAIEDCIWYTVAENGTKTHYDLDAQVSSELHLYTYSYNLVFTLSEASTAEERSFFLTASAVEIDVTGDTLTLTLREGEKPTAADFVVNGVDYSLYTWRTEDGTEVDISDIIANGVTENIVAKSYGSLSDITTRQVTVNFYVRIDGEWTKIQSGAINVYSNNVRYHLTVAQLEEVYGKYGFDAGDIDSADDYLFAHVDSGGTSIWTCTPTQLGTYNTWFIPLLTHEGACDVYYLPANTTTANGAGRDYFAKANTFYSITIKDNAGIYETDAEVPAVSYVLTGETAAVTLQSPDTGEAWKKDDAVLSGTDNGNGTTTYTFENVTAPIVITSSSDQVTVSVEDTGNAVYNETDIRPSETVGIGGDVSITVKNKVGYGWLANGKGITGGQINDNETTITYTFTNVTKNIVLTPVLLKEQVTVNYSIGTLPHENDITSTRPTIKNGATYADTVNLTDSGYIVLTPDKTQYTRTGWNSLVTVVFKGWDTDGDRTVDLEAGQVLTAAELSQYGDTVNLTAVWEDQDKKGSVSFYVNLELEVADYDGTTQDTPDEDYTGAVYGTHVTVDPEPDDFGYADVIQASNPSDTAAIDAKIRTLDEGVSAIYMSAERLFTLDTLPDDETVLASVRVQQAEYIANFEKTHYYNSADPTNVAAYRAVRTNEYDSYGNVTGSHPTYRIICTEDENGVLRYIPVDELTSENYTVRWYVFKYDTTNGWHVDGVLVKKQGQLTITKTFYGNSAAIQAVKNSLYTISVMDGENAIYTLDLDPENTSSNTGYVNHDASTDTYTWKIDLTTNKRYTLKENNYTVASNVVNGMSMASLAEYMVINGDDVPRTNYPSDGISVTAKAYSVDVDYTSYKTAKFYNSYIPTNAMLLRKVDDSKNTLPGIRFQLKKNNQIKQLYQDEDGTYYIYRPADIETKAVDCITTDALGQAIIIGLKDPDYAGDYKLIELEAPEGYSKIEEEMAFNLAENGTLSVVGESSYIDLLEDGITLQVTNTSHTMDVTVKKVWSDNSNKEVKVALYLNGAAMSSDTYEVTLNADNSWTHTWTEMPAYVGGSRASYTIRETWIGESAYSGTIDDGYENYVVTYSNPAYTYDSSGMPTALALTVTNRTDSGEVEFTKVDHNNVGLQGAVFQLYSDADCTTAYGREATSQADGKVSFGNLAAGVYYMKETQAPDGYQANSTVYEVKVTGSGTTIKKLGTDTAITTISNIPANANLWVKKTDDKGNTLTDASFELYKKNADDGWDKQAIDGKIIFTVDSNGMINFTNLSNGDYKLVETSAPAGYYRLTEEIPFTVDLGNVTCVSKDGAWTFTNGDPATITVVNVPGSELPQTGGMGTHFGTMVGLLMMAGSLLYGFLLRRKRERGAV